MRQFVMFAGNGVLTAVVYSVVVWALISLFPDAFVLNVIAAYTVAVICNYVGARQVFRPGTAISGHGWRYASVVVANFSLTAGLAWVAHRVGLPEIAAVYLPVAVTVLPTYVLMRTWVFARPLR